MRALLAFAAAVVATSAWGQSAPPPFVVHVITNPEWARQITAADYASVYPAKALKARVGGEVRLRCAVAASGAVRKCTIEREDPAGQGFGAAAITLLTRIGAMPGTRDGEPADGAFTTFVRFSPP